MDPNNVIVNSITEDQGLLNDKVRGITSDIENNKWVATSDGIVVINNQDVVSTYHTRPYTLPPPDTLNPVVAVEANTQGCIWAGIYVDYLVTVGGVSLWDGIEWMEFDEADGLIGPVIQCVAVDFEDNVWVGTSTGVSKIVHPCEIMTNVRAPKISVEFEVFPNPVNQVLHVKWGDDFISKIQDVKLYDASMKMVGIYSVDAFQNELQINMSSMSEGVYFVGVGDSFEKVVK